MSDAGVDLAVLCGLAVNPAAPVSMLMRLAGHPSRGGRWPSLSLLDRVHLPPPVAEALAGHPSAGLRGRLVGHPGTPNEVRCVLAGDSEPGVRTAVAAWPAQRLYVTGHGPVRTPPLPAEVYRGLAADPAPPVRIAVGCNHHVPIAVRAMLAADADPQVRRAATVYGLPPPVLHILMCDVDRAVRRSALSAAAVYARDVTIPPYLAELFDNEPVYYRQQAVALVELTPPLLDRLLARPDLREALARNPGLPAGYLRLFLADADLHVALAENPSLSVSHVDQLVAAGDPEVHRELLRRTDLPDRLRRRLIAAGEQDEQLPLVPSLLSDCASLDERLSYLTHPNPAFRRTLALSTDLPRDAVRVLAADPDHATRLLLCEHHTDVPPAMLTGLAETVHGHSRDAVLSHPRLPVEAVTAQAAGGSARDRAVIAARPDLPPELAMRLVADREIRVRRVAAANPNLPRERVHRLLTDPDPALREGAASNPTLSVAELERLLTGG